MRISFLQTYKENLKEHFSIKSTSVADVHYISYIVTI